MNNVPFSMSEKFTIKGHNGNTIDFNTDDKPGSAAITVDQGSAMNHAIRNTSILALLCLIFSLSGCDETHGETNFSEDLSALREIVDINIQAQSVKWEIFTSPDQTAYRFAIGPTDSVVLVAELFPSDRKAFAELLPGEKTIYASGSARPWLEEPFRNMLQEQTTRTVDLSMKSDCRPLHATLKKTGKRIDGFICRSHGKDLVYLFLADESSN
jgi:hypothetical protein